MIICCIYLFQIIHLVRDPRGIAYSRHLLKKGQDLRHSLNFTCTKQAKNAKIGLFDPPKWLQGRYKVENNQNS